MMRFFLIYIPVVLTGRGFLFPPEMESGKSLYSIIVKNDTVGTITHIVDTSMVEEVPIYRFYSIIHANYGEISSLDSTMVAAKRENLQPILSRRIQIIGDQRTEVTAYYEEKKAILILKTKGSEKKLTFDLHGNVYDNGELVFLLRAFNFKPKNSVIITNVAPMVGRILKMNVRYAGEEDIIIGNRRIDVHHLELRMEGKKMDVYFEKRFPHRMVKYLDEKRGVTYILK
jgi:hypothetical protein